MVLSQPLVRSQEIQHHMYVVRATFWMVPTHVHVKNLDFGLMMLPLANVSYSSQLKVLLLYTSICVSFNVAVDCGTLPDPDNGRVTVFETTLGSPAVYSCNPGFQLVGEARRICTDSGKWSDKEPACSRELNDSIRFT